MFCGSRRAMISTYRSIIQRGLTIRKSAFVGRLLTPVPLSIRSMSWSLKAWKLVAPIVKRSSPSQFSTGAIIVSRRSAYSG
jgi:hypothetical protein